MVKQISSNFKWKFSNATCSLTQNGILINVNATLKSITLSRKFYSWNPITCVYEDSIYLKSIADDSVTVCQRI